ncbi:methyl-accepting chemotaxis protein [Brevibacillus sp. TJ4]|uniref:methyl-accepting chemotaxis protein n=1 Tax=Brevibacillus sp. TJ4 TaxID=3234853 RepID=UPI0037CDC781
MKWFSHITISKKLVLIFTVICLVMALIGFLGNQTLVGVNKDLEAMYQQRFLPVIQLMQVNKAISENAVLLVNAATLRQDYAKLEESVLGNLQNAQDSLNAYGQTSLTPEERSLVDALDTLLQAYQSSMNEALALVKNGDEQGLMFKLNGSAASQKTAIEERIAALVELQDGQSKELYHNASVRFDQSQLFTIVLIAVGILLSLMFGFFLRKMIALPIQEVQKRLNDIANAGGDLTQRLEINSRDEVGQLATACNRMLETIQGIMKEVLHDAQTVAETASMLFRQAEQTSVASSNIASSVQQIAVGSESQVESISAASASLTQMVSGIQQISASAQEATATANLSRETAEKGKEIVEQSMTSIEGVSNNVLKASELILHLNQSAQTIGSVIKVISDIAAQTNLLSLNAGIEAARASEHGRGFAVVAEEIRKLSDETRSAAEQITKMIQQLQQETTRVSSFMLAETKNVQVGLQAAEEAREAFQHIHVAIDKVTSQVHEVSAATVQMSAGAEEILQSVDTVMHVATTASESAKQSREVAQDANVVMEQMVDSISTMTQVSQRLKRLVGQFTV